MKTFTGFWWIVSLTIIGASFIAYITIKDGFFDPWYLLVPAIILVIGMIQFLHK